MYTYFMSCITFINDKQWRNSGVKKCFNGGGELKGGLVGKGVVLGASDVDVRKGCFGDGC